ncbi:MAG: biotin carboxylase N-terminal domain-containing protein, partial [Candidatus Marinimicrobia bacterium]|nr:biotin carboxylase N-terminal domain-containing protein [Candidatus Neomarinimicrobiota bacterium]
MALKKILIANRGEIALRIIRACHELDIPTVAVYSKADKLSLHVRFSDEAICIGEANPRDSYLNVARIMAAAELTNADAIHPGYGFLSENADFAELCKDNHLVFIGPSADVIRNMGDKARARKIMMEAGVPVIPGSEGIVKDVETAEKIANELGYPIILKAAAGGGGKGMRIVNDPSQLRRSFNTAKTEAESAFGNGDLYIEHYIHKPRHIEIQVLGDLHGNIYALGERECSIQRHHQKLIEESPSTAVDPNLRQRMQETAVRASKVVDYTGAGTIEFLLDDQKNFYFMEMNTRIQVEHAITEMVMGMDLVKKQIQIADGFVLSARK